MRIGILSYYTPRMKTGSDGTRENGNLRWMEFYKTAKERNILYELYDKRNHKNYDLIIIRDIPKIYLLSKILINNFFKKKVPLLLLIEETPIARNRFLLKFEWLFNKICIATSDHSHKRKNNRYSTFFHSSLPNKDQLLISDKDFINQKRNKFLCYVSRKKSSINKLSTYKKRNSLITELMSFDEFDLYGSGWDKFSIPMDLPLIALILRFKKPIINTGTKFIQKLKSKGSPKEKLKVMQKYKYCLAFEPYIGKPYSALEKIFDPMIAGCIPVYLGIDAKNIKVPANTFIKIDKNITGKELINKLKKISNQEERLYRNNIYMYLNSKEADNYRYETFSNFLHSEIENLTN